MEKSVGGETDNPRPTRWPLLGSRRDDASVEDEPGLEMPDLGGAEDFMMPGYVTLELDLETLAALEPATDSAARPVEAHQDTTSEALQVEKQKSQAPIADPSAVQEEETSIEVSELHSVDEPVELGYVTLDLDLEALGMEWGWAVDDEAK
jgi:hypothetical protein